RTARTPRDRTRPSTVRQPQSTKGQSVKKKSNQSIESQTSNPRPKTAARKAVHMKTQSEKSITSENPNTNVPTETAEGKGPNMNSTNDKSITSDNTAVASSKDNGTDTPKTTDLTVAVDPSSHPRSAVGHPTEPLVAVFSSAVEVF